MAEKIERLLEYLASSPQDPFLQHALGLEYVKAGELLKAREIFIEILTRNPDYIGSYYHLGKTLQQLGEDEEAITWYQKGIEAAGNASDRHAQNELKGALEELTF